MEERNTGIGQEKAEDALPSVPVPQIVTRLGALSLADDTILRDYQQEAFNDVVSFFAEGGRECYVQQPTGSGKTVLFVEFCKRLHETAPEGYRPRAIVLEPTIDLTTQTVGSIEPNTGKRRGFKGFAPELDVRPYQSKISKKVREESLVEADVLVTTYDSFRGLIDGFKVAETKTPAEWDEEKSECEKLITKLTWEKADTEKKWVQFIKDSYTAQELRFAGSAVFQLLGKSEVVRRLTDQEMETLEAINEIMSREEDQDILFGQVLGKLRRSLTPNIKAHLERREEIRKARVERLKKARDKKKGQENKEPTPATEEDLEEIKDELPEVEKLTEYEKFVVNFLWNNRRVSRKLKEEDLSRHEDRRAANNLQHRALDIGSQITHTRGRIKAIESYKVLLESVKRFDLLICDEAHRSIGSETWDAIRSYAAMKDIAIIGLTATDAYTDRTLEEYFEAKAHELTKQEAIKKEIVNPVALFVHNTGLRYKNVGIDASGDYDRTTIREMRFSEERNSIAVDYAKTLSEQGYGGIMSAIPGDVGEHAVVLAEMINQQEMLDPNTGEMRNMRAKWILNSSKGREEYYKAFEAGDIDWLVFVDVIREGWDSDRAKALVNARPTRSLLVATQRLGRIGRTNEGAPVSVVVDLFDGIEGEDSISEIPPVLGVDVFGIDDIEQGHVVGGQKDGESPTIQLLRSKMSGEIQAHHSRFVKTMEDAPIVDGRGIAQMLGKSGVSMLEWQTEEALRSGYGGFLPHEILADAIVGEEPKVKTIRGRKGKGVVTLYNSPDVKAMYADKPEVNVWKLYKDKDGEKWVTPEGCTRLLSKRLPHIRAQDIENAIRILQDTTDTVLDREIGRVRLSFSDSSSTRMGLVSMYKLNDIMEKILPVLS